MDKFSENFQMEGGGVIFNSKIYIADFGPSDMVSFGLFPKKIAT